MTWWPGWNSINGTSTWGHVWFWFGIACLFLLGASEVIAYMYGLRKDELVAAAQHQEQTQHNAETTDIKRQLAEAQATAKSSADELKRISEPRHLKADESQRLKAFLATAPAGKFKISASTAASDAFEYGREIATVFQSAGWEVEVHAAIFMGGDTTGIWITVRDANIPEIANTIYKAISAAGVVIRGAASPDGNIPANEVVLNIGAKM